MGETALDRLRKQKENNNYSIEEQIESSSENQMDADSLVLTQMSNEAITTLKKKRKLEKVELEPEKPIIEDKKVEVPKPIMTKSEDKKLERDKMEQFIHSLALDLLATCKKLSINFHEFNSEQLNILWDYILSKVEKE